MNQTQPGLKKELKTRHMTMISIAGVIGAGLFVGSGSVIHSTGPGAIVSYALAGLLVIFIMRMLGEMSAVNPTSGSFSQYAHDAIGPWAGFTIGWLYWFFWVIVIAIEAIAGAGIIQYWYHDIPLWLTSLILTIVLTLTNIYSVKSFGEFEYWFSLIKVVTIIAFLIVGFAFIFGIAPGSEPVGFSNITGKGGFFPEGVGSVLLGIVVVIFSFMGTEIVAIAAGETSNPVESVTKATRSVVWRIIVFYVGSIAIVVALLPWNSANILESPFVAVLEHIGVPAAAQIMNFIVLTAVLSCLNSGLYTTSRMLYSLAERNEAPRRFMKLSKKGVPVQAIVAGTFFSYIAVVMNYFSPDTVFLFLVNSSGAIALLVYLVIAVSQLRMRKKLEKTNPEALKIKMWLFPFLTYLTIIAICGILVSMAFIDSMRDELLLTGVITGIVLISYLVFRKRKVREKAAAKPVTQQQPDILP
ncbi:MULTISPECIES: GABA permease [unclassified Bacillus (in: firmicutes)]|uniref:GABA permease n=1 Tax=unclassified Bacillus (in: firmicutes) TaxID=185979 RepID=UPI00227E74E2|nr:GABA permease [Bacillus sp. S20C3]MCY8203786.1 GABA permease [Bacillus sp. N12A5]MCY8289902.1 GABA permease [Bacillus sp. N13C7]MCY8638790.1 GABA permease [Bacillus sp. S17B2]MCY8719116.1 GABA permease [Bacillus sp. S10C12M]MCY9145085.1 GABA permease [Bacillus sp. T9C1]